MPEQHTPARGRRPLIDRRTLNKTLASTGLAMATMPAFPGVVRAEDKLTYFTWAGYEKKALHRDYANEYGHSPDISFFGSEEEALQKIRSGFQPDVAHPCSEKVDRWRDGGVLAPIDTSRIERWGAVWDSLKDIEGTVDADGNRYFVPFDWGNASVIYRPDKVDMENETWGLLFDERYKGRISMFDDADSAIQVAALVLGYDNIFTLNDEQLAEVRKLLEKQRELVRFYWTDQTSLEQALASGEIIAAYAWNASVQRLKEQGVPIAYANPKEGIMTWVCGLTRLKGHEIGEDRIYNFMNAMLSPEAGVFMAKEYGYGHANRETTERVSAKRLEELGLSDPNALLTGSIFQRGVEKQYKKKYVDLFENVKLGG